MIYFKRIILIYSVLASALFPKSALITSVLVTENWEVVLDVGTGTLISEHLWNSMIETMPDGWI